MDLKMKMYKVLDTKNNREFKPELIGKAFYNGIESGEYIILQVAENETITILLSEVEILEGKNLMNKKVIDDGIKHHEVIGESENGYRVIYSTEEIKNIFGEYTNRIMRVVIYNYNTKKVVYSTGNNLRLDYNTYIKHTNEILYLIDKYADDNYNLKIILDKMYYGCSINLERLKAEYNKYLITRYYQSIEDQCKVENVQLKKKVESLLIEKDIYITALDNVSLYVFDINNEYFDRYKTNNHIIEDKRLFDLFFDNNNKEFIVNCINNNYLYLYRIEENTPIKELYDTNKGVYIYDSKMNELLKWLIDYIQYNIN